MTNKSIWESVQRTDPQYTKEFNRGGGFKGTGINSTYMAKRATETFGPMGIGWGVEIVDEDFMEGHVIDAETGQKAIIHRLKVKLWYKHGDQIGEVYHFGQTTFVGKNKFGAFTDEEAPKKSLTDATNKALSMLGFSADIYMGMYDDQAYREEVTQQAALERADNKDEERAKQAEEYRAWKDEHIGLISTAASLSELETLFKLVVRKMSRQKDEAGIREATEAKDKSKERLNDKSKAA